GQDRDLGDRALLSLDHAGTLVEVCEIRIHVSRVATAAGHFLTGGTDLAERFTIVGHIRQDDEHVHTELESKVFGSGEGETGSDDTLDGRVIRKVEEDNRPLQRTGALEVLHEVVRFFLGDTHGSEDYREVLGRAGHFCLAGNLQRNIVVRETCTREDRELLATDKGVGPVDRGDTGLDEIRRHAPCVRVDCGTVDVEALLRDYVRAAIDRLTATGQDTSEHVLTHGHLDGLAREPDTAVFPDTGGCLENLDNDEFIARVEHLAALGCTIGEDYVHEFSIGNRLGLFDKDERPGNLAYRPVFLHAADLSVLNSSSICFMIFASSGL